MTARADDVRGELEEWWRHQCEVEIEHVVHKAVAYGQSSLEALGEALVRLLPEHLRDDSLALEMACAFYAQGKLSRIFASYERGEIPDYDNWYDLGVYTRMAQRIQQTGGWVA